MKLHQYLLSICLWHYCTGAQLVIVLAVHAFFALQLPWDHDSPTKQKFQKNNLNIFKILYIKYPEFWERLEVWSYYWFIFYISSSICILEGVESLLSIAICWANTCCQNNTRFAPTTSYSTCMSWRNKDGVYHLKVHNVLCDSPIMTVLLENPGDHTRCALRMQRIPKQNREMQWIYTIMSTCNSRVSLLSR